MGYEENEQEIDLKEMLFYVLHQWRFLLLAGIIAAVLLGAYRFFRQNQEQKAWEAEMQNSLQAEDTGIVYNDELDSKVRSFRDWNEGTAEMMVLITEAEKKLEKDKLDITNKNDMIAEKEQEIEALQPLLEDAEKQLGSSAPVPVAGGENPELTADSNKNLEQFMMLRQRITALREEIANARAGVAAAEQEIKGAEELLSDLKFEKELRAEGTEYLKRQIADIIDTSRATPPQKKGVFKYALIGFVAGAAVLFMIYILIYVMKPLLRMPDDIRTVFGYPVLGVMNKKVRSRLCAIDKWLMKAEGCGKRPCDEEIVKTAAVSIANTAKPGAAVAVMTTLKENDVIGRITEQLKALVPEMKFVLLTEGISKAANVDELSRCDAVVLVEERNVTSMGKLTADVNQVRLFQKKVLGAIVL